MLERCASHPRRLARCHERSPGSPCDVWGVCAGCSPRGLKRAAILERTLRAESIRLMRTRWRRRSTHAAHRRAGPSQSCRALPGAARGSDRSSRRGDGCLGAAPVATARHSASSGSSGASVVCIRAPTRRSACRPTRAPWPRLSMTIRRSFRAARSAASPASSASAASTSSEMNPLAVPGR